MGDYNGSNSIKRFFNAIKSLFVKDVTLSGKNLTIIKGNGATKVLTTQDTTYNTMTGATASAAGAGGLVPTPAAGTQAKFLRGDGTWQTPPQPDLTPYALKTDIPAVWNADGQLVSPAGWKLYITN